METREARPCPQTNLPAAGGGSQEAEEGRRSGQVGRMPRTSRRDQQRCCWGAFSTLEPLARGFASACGDAIDHIMGFAVRQKPSRTSKDCRLGQLAWSQDAQGEPKGRARGLCTGRKDKIAWEQQAQRINVGKVRMVSDSAR
jgi:hypothetical protein